MAAFPKVIGCIDGTHIQIKAPSTQEHAYVNRKNEHSINAMVCYIPVYVSLYTLDVFLLFLPTFNWFVVVLLRYFVTSNNKLCNSCMFHFIPVC
jgi:hypothetical protein